MLMNGRSCTTGTARVSVINANEWAQLYYRTARVSVINANEWAQLYYRYCTQYSTEQV